MLAEARAPKGLIRCRRRCPPPKKNHKTSMKIKEKSIKIKENQTKSINSKKNQEKTIKIN